VSCIHKQKAHTGIAMVDLEDEVMKVAKIAQLRKAEICAEDNGISDMQSFVVFGDGDRYACRQSEIDGHPFQSLPFVLNDAYEDGLRSFDSLSVVVDAYITEGKDDSYEKGDLRKDFITNPSSSVVECLTVVTYGYHGGSSARVIKYVYNDRGLPEFTLLPEQEASKSKSDVLDFVVSSYIDFCKEQPQS